MQAAPAAVLVHVRECNRGEVQPRPELCQLCPPAYSFESAAHVCNAPCPDNAACSGGSTIVPLKGFWHSAYDSEAMVSCPNPSACQGARGPLLACQDPDNTTGGVSVQDQVGLPCVTQLSFGLDRHMMSAEASLEDLRCKKLNVMDERFCCRLVLISNCPSYNITYK